MFCPKCSQQQPSETMRFCSRCGFPLSGVAILLQNGGVIPDPTPAPQKRGASRKMIMSESAIFTLVAWMIGIVATFWFDYGGPFETVAKIGALLFFTLGLIGVIRFLYGFIVAKDLVNHPTDHRLGNFAATHSSLDAPNQFALPAEQSLPADAYLKSCNTKEMVARPSVTEHTTRVLEEQPTNRSD